MNLPTIREQIIAGYPPYIHYSFNGTYNVGANRRKRLARAKVSA